MSVEVLLYGVFFVASRMGLRGFWPTFLVALASAPLLWWNEFIARGLIGFFLGGAVYFLDQAILAREDAKRIARIVTRAALALWIVALVEAYFGSLDAALYWLAGHVSPEMGRLYVGQSRYVFLLPFIFAVSPLTILALALGEQVSGVSWARLSFLGDISYSTYMLHFPMQLGLALIAVHFALTPAFFENGFALIAFYASLIGLGLLSYNWFERPMQNALRGSRKRASAPVQ